MFGSVAFVPHLASKLSQLYAVVLGASQETEDVKLQPLSQGDLGELFQQLVPAINAHMGALGARRTVSQERLHHLLGAAVSEAQRFEDAEQTNTDALRGQ